MEDALSVCDCTMVKSSGQWSCGEVSRPAPGLAAVIVAGSAHSRRLHLGLRPALTNPVHHDAAI